MTYIFNLERHNAYYEKQGWSHDQDCLCKNTALLAVRKESQKLFVPLETEQFEESGPFKNINE